MRGVLLWGLGACTFLAASSFAAELSISELMTIGLQNNPATSKGWAETERAAATVGIEQGEYYPVIKGTAGLEQAREYTHPKGKEITFKEGKAALLFSYLLLDFGERSARVAEARASLSQAQWHNNWVMQEVMIEVLSAAYDYLKSQAVLDAQKLSLHEADNLVGAAQELFRTGLRTESDVFTSKAGLGALRIQIAEQKAEVDVNRGRLARALGWSADVGIEVTPLPDPVQGVQQEPIDIAPLLLSAQNVRADIAAKRAQLQSAQARETVASKKYLPKVQIFGEGGYRHYWHDRTQGASYRVGIALEVPIFNGFKSSYTIAQARAEALIAQAGLDAALLDVSLEVWSKSRWATAAQEIWALADANLHNAENAYQTVLEKYTAGTLSVFDLTNALNQLTDARVQSSLAKARWYNSVAQLAYALGTLSNSEEVCAPY